MSDIKYEQPHVERPNRRPPLETWKQEIFGYYEKMKTFTDLDSLEVFQCLSQFSARASELRARIPLNAGREDNSFRTRVLDPFIEECDRQFKLHSRITAINEMDARLAGGRFA